MANVEEPEETAPPEDANGTPRLLLRYSHHIIEHLGLKLYQNKPTNVIAELVSNGWDANARTVQINLETGLSRGSQRYLAAADDGGGMTLDDLADSYLVIGKPKDRSNARAAPRYPMGRKGIGKLAPFGIARTVEVLTGARTAGQVKFNWIKLRLDRILAISDGTDPVQTSAYPPDVIVEDGDIDTVRTQPDPTGEVAKFLQQIGEGTGTLILMSDLSLLRTISADQLRSAMGRRFTVTISRPDFVVSVNGRALTLSDALPDFEFRIPAEGVVQEAVGDRTVKFWVGFVRTASWPQDEAGVGVYAHGKIAQDRPFTFGVRGKEIFTRYMYGVVEADFLDELDEDVISTDRRTIDWEHPRAAALYDWGQRKVRQWIEDYRANRRAREVQEVRDSIDRGIAAGDLPKIREDEKKMISDLLAEITPGWERMKTRHFR